jgi:thiol-disulfide isomerase/thioredoxin
MLAFDYFSKALPYDEFMAQFGQGTDRERWDRKRASIALSDSQSALIRKFTRKTNVLVLAGAWCGDCAGQCPILERFAELAPCLIVKYLDRDVHAEAQKELQINGGNRVPVAVFFSEDGQEVARFGERTLTQYRRMIAELGGDSCGTGIGSSDGIVQDWLDVVERVQWILRLSPRLRRLHAD